MENSNSILLFTNKERKSDNHPIYSGNGQINGIKYKAAAWINTAKSGETYIKIYLNELIEISVPVPVENINTDPENDLPS